MSYSDANNKTLARSGTLLGAVYAAAFAAIIAVCAWIHISPFGGVPFTLQTFGVFAALLFLGGQGGALSVTLYLLLGAVGLPVFAGFTGGFAAMLGVTGGYITGFLLGALAFWGIETLAKAFGFYGRLSRMSGLAACLLVCYLFGTCWFAYVHEGALSFANLTSALSVCVVPFIVPDLAKMALALLLYDRLMPVLSKIR